MSTRHLESLFQPRSITVVGASDAQPSLGSVVLRNLQQSGFEGPLSVINRKGYKSVLGVPCLSSVSKLRDAPDLAIICTPAATVPKLVHQLGRRGVRAALVAIGGLAGTQSKSGRPLSISTLAAARASGIRLLGPNSLGVLVPRHKLNASYSHLDVLPGELAYVGHSALLGTAMIDWARGRGIGFSHFLTLGDSVDVDTADVIDYLASDPKTRAILLHLERIPDARRFISSVRAASRGKLVLAIKSGRVPESQQPIEFVAPGIPDGDKVYDAVFQRAGVLRVGSTDELFGAVETLTRMQPLRGERLAIIGNGLGPNTLAADALIRSGGRLARFTGATQEALAALLPAFSRQGNPVDLSPLATPALYKEALEVVRRDREVDAALILHAPTLTAASLDYAQTVIEGIGSSRFNVLTSWMGQASVAGAREAFDIAGVPTYDTPDQAVQAFMHMVRHRRNQEYLRETPSAAMTVQAEDREAARKLVAKARRTRNYLDAREVRQLVAAYGIPVAETMYARRPEDTVKLLKQLEPSIALKIVHSTHCHPFVYGDRLHSSWRSISFDLATPEQVRTATTRMHNWVKTEFPDSRVLGFLAQRMRRGRASLQISAGITHDPVFGPLLLFGVGGRQVNILADRRIALPPLNITLARELIRSSDVYPMLDSGTDSPQQHMHELAQLLVALSQMAVEIPYLRGLEINPLVINREGLLALDMAADLGDPDELVPVAIRPYPQELCEFVELPRSKRRVELRPIRGEDEPAHLEFHQRLSAQSIRFRYFYNRKNFSHQELAQMTQIDYGREMAFIASALQGEGGNVETLGEVRAWRDADNIRAEFSLIVRDDLRGEGLGRLLLEKMIAYCRVHGTLEIVGSVLRDNEPMLALARHLGFTAGYSEENDVMELRLPLNAPKQEWQRQRLRLPLD